MGGIREGLSGQILERAERVPGSLMNALNLENTTVVDRIPKRIGESERRGRRGLAEPETARYAMEAGSDAGAAAPAPATKTPIVVEDSPEPERVEPVSYTHLTLPTKRIV